MSSLSRAMEALGIDPQSLPKGEVAFADEGKLKASKSKDILWWASQPGNTPAIVYTVGTEHHPRRGIILRNMHSGDARSIHTSVIGKGPFFHNFHSALPRIYGRTAVLVEGPKDARVLWAAGIPAIAYLRNAPSRGHLYVIRRYAASILWLPDQDPDQAEVEKRSRAFRKACSILKIDAVEMKYPVKDPAMLAGNEDWLERIRNRVREMDIIRGTNYVGTGASA